MTPRRLALCAATLLAGLHLPASAGVDPTAATASAPAPAGPPDTLFKMIFGRDDVWDRTYDEWVQWKKDHYFPITVGAHHWFHVDRDDRIYGNGYGVPGERGTYYYFLNFDPCYQFGKDDFVSQIGAHFQGRLRDSNEGLRSFYSETYWSYEMYLFADTRWGTFKVGQMVKDFGIPWDYSWWEGTPYFDGYKFDPDYGISWHKDFKFSDAFSLPITAQFFLKEDGVNGEEPGADPESVPGLTEQNTAVVRVLPTFRLNKDTTLAIGFSGQLGEIAGTEHFPGVHLDDHHGAWDAEATLTWKNWTLFGEFIRSYGAISPARYVSGGPSDLQTTYRAGLAYNWGPFTAHVNYTKEDDQHPDGHQHVFDVGLNTQLTKNVSLYTEYVKWNVVNSAGVKSVYDDGFELILVWQF